MNSKGVNSAKGSGYGGVIILKDNILTVGIYDRGVWSTLNELDMGNVSHPSSDERKQIEQKSNEIYNQIVSALGKDEFEFRFSVVWLIPGIK